MQIDMERCSRSYVALTICLVLITLLVSGQVRAADEFVGIRCGADIAKSLIGKHATDGPVAQAERDHRDIQLKGRGGDEASSKLFLVSWSICGQEYMEMLDSSSRITDVIATPHQSDKAPLSIGTCGKVFPKAPVIVAILANDGGDKDLPATAAWQVDEAKMVFRRLPVAGLRCPRSEIVTGD